MLIFNLSPATIVKKILLFFIPDKWLHKDDEENEEDEDEESEDKKDKRVVISNINDLNRAALEEQEPAEPVINGEYTLPPLSLLNVPKKVNTKANEENISSNIKILEQVLTDFDINGKVVEAHVGPTVTQYELEIKSGTKVSKILSLNKEIALALAAKDVRIQAPIPGKSTIGIDIPNKVTTPVSLREVLASMPKEKSDNKLLVVLGKDIMGNPRCMEVNKTPHLLIAGATGSGKSVCVNSIITSILMRAKPDEVKLMMIDPKKVELSMYNGAPHLLAPVVTDPKKASVALKKIVEEMERRYELFSETGTKNIEGYNKKIEGQGEESQHKKLPYYVVLIDELADLMLVAAKEVEDSIMRITQMARAAGIHLIVATQRPSTDVITGVVKANIPSRISFAVSSQIDSRTILDMGGAEKLIGKGDMLFLPMGESIPTRIQGSFVSEEEVTKVVNYTIKQQKAQYDEAFTNLTSQPTGSSGASYNSKDDDYDDPLYNEIVDFVIKTGKTSASLLQRKYRLGYNRAARMIDLLEERGIVGPPNGSKPREVLVKYENNDEEKED